MLVRDLMVPTVLTLSPNDAIADADRSMRETSDSAAVVTEDQKVIGLITEKEMAQAPNDGRVADAMRADCAVVAPGEQLADAARAMGEKNQRFMPVVDGGLLVGILSLTDVRRWAREGDGEGRDEVQEVLTLSVGGYESQSPPT